MTLKITQKAQNHVTIQYSREFEVKSEYSMFIGRLDALFSTNHLLSR